MKTILSVLILATLTVACAPSNPRMFKPPTYVRGNGLIVCDSAMALERIIMLADSGSIPAQVYNRCRLLKPGTDIAVSHYGHEYCELYDKSSGKFWITANDMLFRNWMQ